MKELVLACVVVMLGTPSAVATRGELLASEAGDEAAVAVAAGRDWLVRHQDLKTGLWGKGAQVEGCDCSDWGAAQYDVGVTGLALLALLGAPGQHEDAIRAGVQGLIGAQTKGVFGAAIGHEILYSHAISVWSMCEAMDRASIDSEECRAAVEKGVKVICAARNPRGGWRYGLVPNGDEDASISTWCVLALASARRVGFEVDDEHFHGAYRMFKGLTDAGTGRIGYASPGTASARIPGVNDNYATKYAEAISAASLHAMAAIGMASRADRRWEASFALIESAPPLWRDRFGADMYFLMHGSAALHYVYPDGGGDWLETLREVVLPRQATKKCPAGSWEPEGPWCYAGGRVYSTAALVLALDPLITPSLGMEALTSSARTFAGQPGPGLLSPAARKATKRSRKSLGMIEDGLAWLAKHQAEDGYWSDRQLSLKCDRGARAGTCEATESEAKLTCTSLALLAFMGEGHYAGQDGPYRQTTDLALSFLMDTYQPGALTPNSTTYRGRDYGISDRAFPSLALIEAAGGITSPDVHEFAKKAAEGLLAARLDDGGWCRGRGKRTNYETYEVYLEEGSTTGTAMTVLALIRADELGLVELPEDLLRDAFLLIQGLWVSDGSRAFLSADNPSPFTFYTETGQVYTRGDAGTSGALLLERLVMGAEREITKEGKKHLTSMVPNRKNNEATQDDALAWFLLNLALYPNKKTLSKKWAKGVETALDQFQASKGCAKGSWDFYCFRTRSWGGRVYSTSMAILCLQTPLWGAALFGE